MNNYSNGELEAAHATLDHVIPESFVAPSRIAAANFGRQWAVERYGGRTVPVLKYFQPSEQTGSVGGSSAVGSGVIYVSAKLSLPATAGIAAHETIHALGEADEDSCYSIQQQAKSAWVSHRRQLLPALKQRYNEHREKFLAMSASPQRAEVVSSWMGTPWYLSAPLYKSADNPSGSLTIVELDLRTAELEELDQIPDGPARYLQIRSSNPPPPIYSFQLAGR